MRNRSSNDWQRQLRSLVVSKNKNKTKVLNGIGRRKFLKLSTIGAGTIAAALVTGCQTDSSDSSSTPSAQIPTNDSWKFGIISDTQWTKDDDGENPASCAVDIINSLNEKFVEHGADFVVHVGDLTDDGHGLSFDPTTHTQTESGEFTAYNTATETTYTYTTEDAFGIRARYTQLLYNNGIGYYPLRGNHDDSQKAAEEFVNYFPQTKTGENNSTSVQDAAFNSQNPDTDYLPEITRQNESSFTVGSTFSSPSLSGLEGLTYSFDHNNARFVMLDQFRTSDGTTHSIEDQQSWITSTLSGRESGTHAFTFSHKGLLSQNHSDTLFGSDPANASSTDAAVQDAYIQSLSDNDVRYHICGHDHMHDRSYVYTTDGATAKVTQIVTASDSSKFYTPKSTSNDDQYGGGIRQKIIAQELYYIGYYIITIDGDHVTIDYYSSPAYSDKEFTTTPTLNFTLRESFGYSLKGESFLIGQNESYTAVNVTSPKAYGTQAQILAGNNGCQLTDAADREFNVEVSTGWYDAQDSLSDILVMRGMDYNMGSDRTDVYTLSITYNSSSVTDEMISSKAFGLAALNSDGKWVKAVSLNSTNNTKFVNGAWQSGYEIGTWGVDTSSNTVWAVINFDGRFAAVDNI